MNEEKTTDMTQEKLDQIAEMLMGLKRNEWSRIAHSVEQAYDSMSCKLVLQDTESLRGKLEMNFMGLLK